MRLKRRSAKSLLMRVAATAIVTVLPLASQAGEPTSEETRVVSLKGLDLNTPSGARSLYSQLLAATDAA